MYNNNYNNWNNNNYNNFNNYQQNPYGQYSQYNPQGYNPNQNMNNNISNSAFQINNNNNMNNNPPLQIPPSQQSTPLPQIVKPKEEPKPEPKPEPIDPEKYKAAQEKWKKFREGVEKKKRIIYSSNYGKYH